MVAAARVTTPGSNLPPLPSLAEIEAELAAQYHGVMSLS